MMMMAMVLTMLLMAIAETSASEAQAHTSSQAYRRRQQDGAGVAPMWEVSQDELGPCPDAAECGHAAATLMRSVFCFDGVAPVDAAGCTDPKPATSLDCPATAECVVYAWQADAPACPSACGVAESTADRAVTCQGSDGSAAADEASCTEARPPTAAPCAATAACVTYGWSAPDFAPCPTECGLPATAPTRNVTCLGSDGGAGAAANCNGTSPAASRDCPGTTTCITYVWIGQDFDACPTECGLAESTLTRVLTCVGSDGTVGAAEDCTDAQLDTTQTCAATGSCVTYDWSAVDLDPCLTECGLAASTLTRDVVCRGSDGSTGEADNCTAVGSPPEATKDCAVTQNCQWSAGAFEACPTACGHALSTLERDVACTDPADPDVVDNDALVGRCSFEDKPAEGSICDATPACVVYNWVTSAFDACADDCGLQARTLQRDVLCTGDDGSTAADTSSCAEPKPNATHPCMATQDCTATEMVSSLQAHTGWPIGEVVFNYDIENFPAGS